MPVADEEAVLREALLDGIQRAVEVLLRRCVRALGGRKPRAVHPIVDLQHQCAPLHGLCLAAYVQHTAGRGGNYAYIGAWRHLHP